MWGLSDASSTKKPAMDRAHFFVLFCSLFLSWCFFTCISWRTFVGRAGFFPLVKKKNPLGLTQCYLCTALFHSHLIRVAWYNQAMIVLFHICCQGKLQTNPANEWGLDWISNDTHYYLWKGFLREGTCLIPWWKGLKIHCFALLNWRDMPKAGFLENQFGLEIA